MKVLPVLIALLPTVACGGALREQVVTPLDPGLKPRALIVLPVAPMVQETDALDVAARSRSVADLLLRRTELPVFGPWDFSVLHPVDQVRTVATDTDALTRLASWGVDLRDAVALHVLVTESRSTNVRDFVDARRKDPKSGKTNLYRQHGLQSVVRVELAAYEAMRGGRLGGVVLELDDDPTDYELGSDPRPGISRAIERAVTLLLDHTPALRATGKRFTRGEGLLDSVRALMAWRAPEWPSWDDKHKADDELRREAAAVSVWDRFAPVLAPRALRDTTQHPGVLVQKALPPLQPGDVVVAVQGQPVLARHQLDRLLQGCSPCTVAVVRGGQRQELPMAWAPLPAVAE
jgi:hypothetical protein